ncbi:hypothetical protein ANANG_G00297740 [Anguilla anguilla]|uniref:Uncharacterized protein n=1 Tax=Anguilla anguilla TaxID=7936 RepID=A0A9D3LP46_ANGAN|nr:hypothetical protein ANANG_G00297740 [Anguilla anguilla]
MSEQKRSSSKRHASRGRSFSHQERHLAAAESSRHPPNWKPGEDQSFLINTSISAQSAQNKNSPPPAGLE